MKKRPGSAALSSPRGMGGMGGGPAVEQSSLAAAAPFAATRSPPRLAAVAALVSVGRCAQSVVLSTHATTTIDSLLAAAALCELYRTGTKWGPEQLTIVQSLSAFIAVAASGAARPRLGQATAGSWSLTPASASGSSSSSTSSAAAMAAEAAEAVKRKRAKKTTAEPGSNATNKTLGGIPMESSSTSSSSDDPVLGCLSLSRPRRSIFSAAPALSIAGQVALHVLVMRWGVSLAEKWDVQLEQQLAASGGLSGGGAEIGRGGEGWRRLERRQQWCWKGRRGKLGGG